MKSALLKSFPVAALLLAVSLLAAPAAHAQLGVAGGANFDSIGDVSDDDGGYSFDNSTGYHIGVFYDFAFGPIGVRPGVFYMDVGSFSVDGDVDTGGANVSGVDYNLSLVEVPVDLRYRIAFPFIKPYLTAGPAFRFVADDGGDDFGDSTNDFSVAGNAGLGVDFGLPTTSLGFFIEGRYTFGLSSIVNDFEVVGAGVTTSVNDDSRLNAFMLRAGIKF